MSFHVVDVDVFTGSAFPNAATATTDQKVAAAQAYLNKLSVDDRATVYRKCMTAPDDTTLDAALTQTMETFTRDDAKEMADNGVFIASGIIDSRKDEVLAALKAAGLAVQEVKEKRGWECIICKK